MARFKICSLSELPSGKALEKRILARRIAIFNDNGAIYAMEAECRHMKAPLALGKTEAGIVTCQWHGWQYDLKTGACLTHPGMNLKRFPVEISEGCVYLVLD